MLDVLRVGVDLIHQAVFFPVLTRRPVRHLPDEALHIPQLGGSLGHEVVLHLRHAVGRGLDNQVVQIRKISIEHRGAAAAGLRQRADSHGREPLFGVAGEALFHQRRLLFLKFLFIANTHGVILFFH